MAQDSAAGFLQRAYGLSGASDAKNLYNDWAAKYDAHMKQEGYASPSRTVDYILAYLEDGPPKDPLVVLDAGCGTGLVGDYLAQTPPIATRTLQLDGVDLSGDMLALAKEKGCYRDLREADLGQPIAGFEDGAYDLVMCVGTLTKGHVGPQAISEFARLTASGGFVAVTVHDEVWERLGYKAEVDKLVSDGKAKVEGIEDFGILEWESKGAKIVVLRKL